MANQHKSTLKIVWFKNPSGEKVPRVTGTIHGERVQKNFSTRQEAQGYINGRLARAYQGDSSPLRPAATTFESDDDLKDAEIAFARLRSAIPKGALTTVVDFYLANAGRVIKDGNALELVKEFIKARGNRGNEANLKGHPKGYQLGTGSKDTTRSSELMEGGSVRPEQGNFKVYHPVPRHFYGGLGA
jgi:hypothetical protein